MDAAIALVGFFVPAVLLAVGISYLVSLFLELVW